MPQTYFKRYRMQISLRRLPTSPPPPTGYQLLPWSEQLLEKHALVKFHSFRDELDSQVFSCLGEEVGCRRLMDEITQKPGFVPGATWLVAYTSTDGSLEYCGTVQGIRDQHDMGSVQNLGVTPEHRGRGLGTCLLCHALAGFRLAALRSVFLEVTARNSSAVRLYRNLGFRHVKTVYKSVEVAMS